jgi:hypothetical protein
MHIALISLEGRAIMKANNRAELRSLLASILRDLPVESRLAVTDL